MKAITQYKYGTPDVLKLEEVDKPVVGDDDVLLRIQAASINQADWHLLTGTPRIARLAFELFKPKQNIPGLDVAGQVEEVGANVTRFKPGDEVFGENKGAYAEYVCVPEDRIALKPDNLTPLQGHACRGGHGLAGVAGQGANPIRDQGIDHRCFGRRRNICRSDRKIIWSGSDRSVQSNECGDGPIHRR